MRILIAEDDPNKVRRIVDFIAELQPAHTVVERRSYQSSLKEAILTPPDLILLDMSMPSYDLSPNEPGGRFRPFGGWDILKEIKRRSLPAKVIVVTQYESFDDGNDFMTLSELKRRLSDEFPDTYLGTVFYTPSESSWRDELAGLIGRFSELDDKGVV